MNHSTRDHRSVAPDGTLDGRGDAPARAVGEVLAWLAEISPLLACSGISTTWSVRPDSDGALLLLPSGDRTPGFVIMGASGRGLDVLVAQPERGIELGPFETLADALDGIATWLAVPAGHA